jgi:hypothetical protein
MPVEGRGLGSRSASDVTDIQEIGVSLILCVAKVIDVKRTVPERLL